MIQTYIVYLGTLLLCTYFASKAAKKDKKSYVWAIVVLLTLVSGCRAASVGLDTHSYVNYYNLIANGQMQYAYGFEMTFKYFCLLLSKISESGYFFLFLMSALTNGLLIFRFWDFRKLSSFPFMVFSYYCLFFFSSMNGLRQFVAVAIVFYATRYLNRGKHIKFFIGVAIAALFHTTAIIGLLFLVAELFGWRDFGKKERWSAAGRVALLAVAFLIVVTVGTRYDKYLSQVTLDIGIIMPIKFAIFAVAMLFVVRFIDRSAPEGLNAGGEYIESNKYISAMSFIYFAGLCLTALGYFFTHLDRVGWYFYLYEGIFYGTVLKNTSRNNRYIIGLAVLGLTVYAFIYSITHNSQGTVPYLFFWQ